MLIKPCSIFEWYRSATRDTLLRCQHLVYQLLCIRHFSAIKTHWTKTVVDFHVHVYTLFSHQTVCSLIWNKVLLPIFKHRTRLPAVGMHLEFRAISVLTQFSQTKQHFMMINRCQIIENDGFMDRLLIRSRCPCSFGK